MRKQDFYYELPESLIAKKPMPERTASRLMMLDGNSGEVEHAMFDRVLDVVQPGDLIVFNDTQVIPARLFGKKESGGKIEILIERIVDSQTVLAHMRSSKSPKAGAVVVLENGTRVTVIGRADALFELCFPAGATALEVIEKIGHMPLPPYIDREDEAFDRERYQTVYAANKGAVAAPTAGLHFDEAMIEQIKNKGVEVGYVTLHVGAGTFQPVRADNIKEHHMHTEYMALTESLCEQVRRVKREGGRVIAVGTTSVRCLETASQSGQIQAFEGDTDIFIYPGYEFKTVDVLLTNFHLPESTLMMLVSAFAGYENTMQAYRVAVESEYRFFSYGDAMLIKKRSM